jgi:hypothetical protein
VSLSDDKIRKTDLPHSLVFHPKEIWVSGLPGSRKANRGGRQHDRWSGHYATINVLVCTRLRYFSINMLCVIHPDFSKTGPSVAGVLALTIRNWRVAAAADQIPGRMGTVACLCRILHTIC